LPQTYSYTYFKPVYNVEPLTVTTLQELNALEEIFICNTAISDFTPLLAMEGLKKVVVNDGAMPPIELTIKHF